MMRRQPFLRTVITALCLLAAALSGAVRFSGSAEPQVDARRQDPEITRAAARRRTSKILTGAGRRHGPGITP